VASGHVKFGPELPPDTKVCGNCRKLKTKNEFYSVGGKRKRLSGYCKQCNLANAGAWRRAQQGLPADAELPRGNGNAHPIGTVLMDKAGYLTEKVGVGNHLRADRYGWVFQHILIAEKKYGFSITREFTIHHKNKNRSDNRPENLELRVGNHGKGGDLLPTLLADSELQKEAAAILIEYGWNVSPPLSSMM
jgi:hypothetical protein